MAWQARLACLHASAHSARCEALQVMSGQWGNAQANPEYTNWRTTVRHIVQTQGWTGLWAGLLPRGIRVVGACMILQTVRTQLIALAESTPEDVEAEVVRA